VYSEDGGAKASLAARYCAPECRCR